MKTTIWLISSLLLVGACDRNDPAPTAAEKQAAASAQAERDKAQAAKNDADKALADAKEKAKQAEKKLEVAKEKADATLDKVDDWSGPARDKWRDSWAAFAGGQDKTVDVDEWTIERGSDGELTAWRKIKSKTSVLEKLGDAALLATVKTKLALDDDIKARKINVDVIDGVVHLKGSVASAQQAGEAVRLALGTPGVDRVVSHLTWNTRQM